MKWPIAVLALVLAGCSDPPAATAVTDEAFSDFEVPPDAIIIRGVVVDQTIAPMAGARVTWQGGPTQETNAAGAFLFVGVEPGVYVVQVSKLGYYTVQTTATAGAADSPTLRIQLEANPAAVPFYEVKSVRGYLECGMGLPGGGSYSTCQTPVGAVDILCNTTGGAVCLPYVNDHRGIMDIDADAGIPDFAQAEAVWQATTANSNVLTWSFSARAPDTLEFDNGTSFTGESPLVMPRDAAWLVDGFVGVERNFVFQVFPESGGVGNLVLQQKVELFVTTFFNFLPEEGWTLTADGDPNRPS